MTIPPTVSIIVPTYNSANYIIHAIDSIMEQTYHDYELIVVDDGSTDDTANRVAAYRGHLHYLHIAHSGLPAKARNAGIRAARGQYLAFLDADDRWLPDKLERHIAILASKPDVGMLCSDAYVVADYQEDTGSQLFSQEEEGKSGWVAEALLQGCFVCMSSVVIRRDMLNRSGLFCEDLTIRGIEDFDLWLRISALAPLHYDPTPTLIYWDHHNTSIRGQITPVTACRSLLQMHDRFRQFLQDTNRMDVVSENIWQERYYYHYCRLFANLWTSRDFISALGLWWKLFRMRPIASTKLVAERGLLHGKQFFRK